MVIRKGFYGDGHFDSKIDGEYVKYEDYAALEKRHTALLKLVQMAYDAPISDEGMHWVHQAVNNLEDWLND